MGIIGICIGYDDDFIIIIIFNWKFRIDVCVNCIDYSIDFFVF